MASLSTVILSGFLLYIGSTGWDKTNRHIKISFVIFSSIAAFSASLPITFKHEINIRKNTDQYLRYIALENEIAVQLAIMKKQKSEEEEEEIANIITNTSNELNKLHQVNMEFESNVKIKPMPVKSPQGK